MRTGRLKNKITTNGGNGSGDFTEDKMGKKVIAMLNNLADKSLLESIAMTHTCMTIMCENHSLGNKIRENLRERIEEVCDGDEIRGAGYDIECDILPVMRWLSFRNGFFVGSFFGKRLLGSSEHIESNGSYQEAERARDTAQQKLFDYVSTFPIDTQIKVYNMLVGYVERSRSEL